MKKFVFSLLILLLLAGCSGPTEEITIENYTIEQFYENIKIRGGSFSEDESKLIISSNETGIFNAYEISIADGVKTQLTKSDNESFIVNDYVPGTNQVIYSADKGGNEINHLFLLKEDGTSVDLTPEEDKTSIFFGWSSDDRYLYYHSNKRNPQFFDLYKMKVGEWTSEMIYENNDGLDITGISDDESYFTFEKMITMSTNKLFLKNVQSGEIIEISSDEKPGTYSGSGFSKNNQYYYYITDIDKEFRYLVQYEIETGTKSIIFETDWDVTYSYLSKNEKYRVIAINEDGKTNLIVIDNTTGENVDFPQIPDGNIVSLVISRSEKKMRLTVSTSKSPSNIYVYNLETKELTKLTESLNPEINPDHLVSAEVVRYKSFDGLEIPAIYYKPLTATADNKVPALVWVHGGPGGQTKIGFSSLLQFLVNNGYAILAVNNRGSSGYGKTFFKMDDLNHGDKDLKDCIYGKKWLQEQDYIDSGKIGIMGGSYGGFMTMAAMTFTPDEFKVGVNIFGATNWIRTLKSIPPYWESFREALYAEMGDPFTEDSVRLYNISPLFHAEKVKNPIMVLQGANDPRVLQVESDEIVEAVKKNGVAVEYIVFPDEGHGFIKKKNEINGYGKILIFLDTYLKGNIE